MRPAWNELLVGLPLAGIAGLLVGALGTFKHQVGLGAAGTGLPIGLLLCLLMVAAVLVALRVAFDTRLHAAAAAAGVLAAVLVLAQPGPGGSVVVFGLAGIVWVAGAIVLGVVLVAVPAPRHRNREPADGILDVQRDQ
ncbi:hypothetical protein QDR37_15400 [Amnibacterium sp. CER49]|uniref:hypothetical protein n=1 Tax=Amnibacterium sp. CER49 TaxID=3039161 RepID=UPI00244A1994|nr:hypothetical protein [Amnibacterium sp. CER49]MDH2445336.1 hypothetical protein [Amnibacterium sp. CER49]